MRQPQPLLASMLLAAVFAVPVAAQENVWWCDVVGQQRLNFDAGGIAFNEHTLCTTQSPVTMTAANGDTWSGDVACYNVYVTGQDANGVWQSHEMRLDTPTWLSLAGAADGTLYLRERPDGPERAFLPC